MYTTASWGERTQRGIRRRIVGRVQRRRSESICVLVMVRADRAGGQCQDGKRSGNRRAKDEMDMRGEDRGQERRPPHRSTDKYLAASKVTRRRRRKETGSGRRARPRWIWS